MWKHCCALVCALAALLYNTSASVRTTSDPSTFPLLQFDDLNYMGAFKLPTQSSNGDTFEIGGHPVAYNPARNSLFIGSRLGRLAEVSIPTPVNSANVNQLPRATYLQGFYEPTEGNLWRVGSSGVSVDGILVYGNRLYGTGSIFYDANNVQTVSHFSRSQTLSQGSFAGWSQVWEPEKSGFVSGFMALVPDEWQDQLGGPAITGQFGIPIAWRTSWGPSAFAFNPTLVGAATVPASPLLYYTSEHHTLGHWSGSNPTYGANAQAGGVAIIAGTRTILYFGRNGMGPYCYGNGTSTQSLHGTMGPDGAHWCYDPTSTDKGQHAYPYRYQIWAYDLNDLAAVKAGSKMPWEVVPYGVWPFELPTPEPSIRIAGVGYDSARQTIYLVQMRADKDGYANRPIVHVLNVGGVAGSPLPQPSGETTPPPPPPAPPPAPSAKVSSVTITASKSAPQAPGTAIVLTATPTGGAAPHQYKWHLHNDVQWAAISGWSASNTFSWTPTTANSKYKLAVWVRSAGKTTDAAEASTNLVFPISGTASAPAPPPAAAKVTSVGLSANKAAPQVTGTAITFSAIPSGGASPIQYKWRVFNGSSWTSGSWTTSSSYAWTPAISNGSYRVEVWTRSSGNAADQAEALVGMAFPIVQPTTTPPPTTPPAPPTNGPPPSSSPKVSYLAITASKAPPQAPGTTVVLTASAIGGVAPHQYEWWLYDGIRWTEVRNWSTSNSYTWAPAIANTSYRLNVKVRSAGKTSEIEEAKAGIEFPISSTVPPSTAPPPTVGTSRATAVTLTANKAAPQAPGAAITWTASAVAGGVAPYQYKFYVWDTASWKVVRGWNSSNTFTWVPASVNPYYKVSVQVRSAGNTSDDYEATTTSGLFPIR